MKALELADKLDAQATWVPSDLAGVMYKSATELHRLADLNAGLVRALQECKSDLLFAERVDKSANFQASIKLADHWISKATEQQ